MSAAQAYILIALLALAVVSLLVLLSGRGGRTRRLSPLAGVALACVVSGVAFGDERFIGYALIGVGVGLAIVDIVRKRRGSGG